MVASAKSTLDNIPLPYATGLAGGCGGRLKEFPSDFQVEEIPLYPPAGKGEHLYLWVEKEGCTTAEVAAHLGRSLSLPLSAVGWAGKKDARAVSRQWISVHTSQTPDPSRLEGPGFRILAVERHGNKLRAGHLQGNRFVVTVRGIDAGAGAETILRRLGDMGFPNYFGPQRLGDSLANALAGRRMVRAGSAGRGSLERLRFETNAYQAALFNTLVATRLVAMGGLDTLLAGDLAILHRNGATFALTAEMLEEAQARADHREISPSAPLFGYRVPLAEGVPGQWERDVLEGEGLTLERFRLGGKRLSPKGERRAVRAFPAGLAWEFCQLDGEPCLILRFSLERGVYATSLLREVMKNDDLCFLPPQAQKTAS